MSAKTAIVSGMLVAGLLIGGALPSLADARSDCRERIRRAETNLKKEIERHGERGKDVEKRKRELQRERERCRAYESERGAPPPEAPRPHEVISH